MINDLSNVKSGDVVLLHGCCHNPTGIDLNQSQWETISDLLLDRKAIPLIDFAYQGFGDGEGGVYLINTHTGDLFRLGDFDENQKRIFQKISF